jgi:23S rRNA pseudouridine1911/1915/1917 synthase
LSNTRTFTVEAAGERLDRFLAGECPELSRSRLRGLILDGHVTLDSAPAKPASTLRAGHVVTLTVPDPVESHLVPQAMPLTIAYEDRDILVVDKPAGMTVHPAPGHRDRTLANAVLAHCPDLTGIGGVLRPGIVHRLDKDTSGLLVVAKGEKAHEDLSRQLKERRFTKRYLALVHGRISPAEAMIDAPVGRDTRNRKRMAVVERGRESTTRYRVTTYYKGFSLVEATPQSGRTHQIRVHFASLGHPLAGDATYGRRHPALDRHFLHARLLGFKHPSTGEYVEFTSDLPAELQAFLDALAPASPGG